MIEKVNWSAGKVLSIHIQSIVSIYHLYTPMTTYYHKGSPKEMCNFTFMMRSWKKKFPVTTRDCGTCVKLPYFGKKGVSYFTALRNSQIRHFQFSLVKSYISRNCRKNTGALVISKANKSTPHVNTQKAHCPPRHTGSSTYLYWYVEFEYIKTQQ